MASMTYIITGDPLPIPTPRATMTCKMWDEKKQLKLLRLMQIQNQHQDAPKLQGPLNLDVTFFFRTANRGELEKWHTYRPRLSDLVKFAEEIATGIALDDECYIASITAHKFYDIMSKTKLTLTQL